MAIFLRFLMIGYSHCELLSCDENLCPPSDIGDSICEFPCNIAPCGYDSSSFFSAPNGGFNFSTSDCYQTCLDTQTCDLSLLNNTICDAGCNTAECGWDLGDCGYCAQNCPIALLTNDVCDEVCEGEICSFDNHACGLCALGCFEEDLYAPACSPNCNVTSCEALGNNPCYLDCSPGCSREMLLNGYCDEACSTADCWYDEGACLCDEGCTPDIISEESCRGDSDPCATTNCYYKNGACGTCALLCYDSMLGNGVCDPECNHYQCNYDYSDCGCAPGCGSTYSSSTGWTWDTSGSEACLVPACEYNYGAGFSDPFLVREHILSQIIYRN